MTLPLTSDPQPEPSGRKGDVFRFLQSYPGVKLTYKDVAIALKMDPYNVGKSLSNIKGAMERQSTRQMYPGRLENFGSGKSSVWVYYPPDINDTPAEMIQGDSLAALFALQTRLQRQLFSGTHPKDFNNEDRSEYVRSMVVALDDELHEALAEIAWKPWASDKSRFNRDAFVREVVDAFHFLINLFLAAGATAEEVFAVYSDKHEVNTKRHEQGYDGVSGKCPSPCSRALDDYPTPLHVVYNGVVYHSRHCVAYAVEVMNWAAPDSPEYAAAEKTLQKVAS